MKRKRTYGWRPDLPDARDHLLTVRKPRAGLPASVDLRPQCPPVVDQGELGSCTANAIAGAFQFDEMAQGKPSPFAPSRLFIYYGERVIEHSVKTDAGAMIRDGFKMMAKTGVCPETLWPYDIAKFARKPAAKAYTAAKANRVSQYRRLDSTDIGSLKACLAGGKPFVAGFSVYESFESAAVAKTGVVPMPGKSESLLGGHAILVVGYDDKSGRFLVRNSWGSSWGMSGYFTIPYAYYTNPNLADDFWTLDTIP